MGAIELATIHEEAKLEKAIQKCALAGCKKKVKYTYKVVLLFRMVENSPPHYPFCSVEHWVEGKRRREEDAKKTAAILRSIRS